ncbi:hypothetical protein DPEC_G00027430 [Dallia pectoralis]|uniref:Uncharacterized protein n=1 Tax=Dallia pectoralis TaxID=75939 RepID=A0ACC2HHU5_DALPE|nr:hypothetical protein DPEC_G00027430 [Dallia pectoralis]
MSSISSPCDGIWHDETPAPAGSLRRDRWSGNLRVREQRQVAPKASDQSVSNAKRFTQQVENTTQWVRHANALMARLNDDPGPAWRTIVPRPLPDPSPGARALSHRHHVHLSRRGVEGDSVSAVLSEGSPALMRLARQPLRAGRERPASGGLQGAVSGWQAHFITFLSVNSV